jgi:hypothetical protein
LADEYAFEDRANGNDLRRDQLESEFGILNGSAKPPRSRQFPSSCCQANQAFRHSAVCRPIQQWRCNMKKLVTGMLVTSVALAMLVGTEGAYAEAPDVTHGRQDRGTAIDTRGTGEEGISGPRVRVQPGDVDLPPSVVQDEKQMEPELDAIAKELEKLENRICRGC